MKEKTLLKQKTRISNIHSSEVGAISYDIFGSPYQKTGSFLADVFIPTVKNNYGMITNYIKKHK